MRQTRARCDPCSADSAIQHFLRGFDVCPAIQGCVGRMSSMSVCVPAPKTLGREGHLELRFGGANSGMDAIVNVNRELMHRKF